MACLVGSAFNLEIGWYLVDKGIPWFFASFLGALAGMSLNYLSNGFFTWGTQLSLILG
jgi:putative flippase GtrA